MPVKTAQELVDYAKKNPGKLAFASSGSGTSIHMAGELFKMQTGIDAARALQGQRAGHHRPIGGQVQFMFDNMPSAWPHVQSGVRALAVTTTERPRARRTPTMKEAGFANFDVSSWFGLIAPAGTPPEVINKLNAAMVKALDKPEVQRSFEQLGAVGVKTTPAEFGQFIKSEVKAGPRWSRPRAPRWTERRGPAWPAPANRPPVAGWRADGQGRNFRPFLPIFPAVPVVRQHGGADAAHHVDLVARETGPENRHARHQLLGWAGSRKRPRPAPIPNGQEGLHRFAGGRFAPREGSCAVETGSRAAPWSISSA